MLRSPNVTSLCKFNSDEFSSKLQIVWMVEKRSHPNRITHWINQFNYQKMCWLNWIRQCLKCIQILKRIYRDVKQFQRYAFRFIRINNRISNESHSHLLGWLNVRSQCAFWIAWVILNWFNFRLILMVLRGECSKIGLLLIRPIEMGLLFQVSPKVYLKREQRMKMDQNRKR